MQRKFYKLCLLILILSVWFSFRCLASINDAGPRDKYVPGELIIKLKPGVQFPIGDLQIKTFNTLSSLSKKFSAKSSRKLFPYLEKTRFAPSFKFRGEVRKTPDLSNIYILNLPPDTDIEKVAEEYRKDKNVIYAEPNYIVRACMVPNDPDFSQQHGLTDIRASEAWDLETGNSNVIIAIVDTGVDMNHEDLDEKIWLNMGETPDDSVDNDGNGYVDDVHGWDFVDVDNDPSDYMGHGTHVAGIATAETDNGAGIAGVCWAAQIMPIRILNNSGKGTYTDAAEAVIYAAQKGAKVINMSFGSYTYSYVFEDALANAYQTALLVAAAGNDKTLSPFYPAAYAYVVGVGGMGAVSNYGDNTDVYAPGGQIFSTVPHDNYIAWSGTSMAAPFVSGLAALAFSHYPEMSQEDIRARIMQTTDYLGQVVAPGGTVLDEIYFINAYNAISVVSIPPDIQYVSHIIDDSVGDGDNDGVADSGETVNMVFTVKNYGGLATNVLVTLQTKADPWTEDPDPLITIVNDTASFSAISAYATEDNDGSTGTPGDTPFVFSVAPDTPNNHQVLFVLDISADGGYETSLQFSIFTQRGREISGIIDHDTTWGGYRYIVTGNVLVQEGVTLTIEPGTEILFDKDKGLQVDGCLKAVGTEDNMILFSSNSSTPAPGDWRYIYFTGSSSDAVFDANGNYISGSIIKYTEVELGGGIRIDHASPYIAYNFLHGNQYVSYQPGGINMSGAIQLNESASIVKGNLISANYGQYCGGINLIFFSGQVCENTIEANTSDHHAGAIYISHGAVVGPSGLITKNIIRGNQVIGASYKDGAIYIYSGSPSITDNVIFGNQCFGIAFASAIDGTQFQVQTNTIMDNFGGISVWGLSNPIISFNNILNNTKGENYNIHMLYSALGHDIYAQNNYWGTTDADEIQENIWDYYDDFSLGKVFYQPFETTPVVDAPGFLYQVELEPPSPVSIQTVTFTLTFSRAMDTSIEPMVTFGVDDPYTQHQVFGSWIDDTHWQGTYDVDITTGDGINRLRVTRAKDPDGMEIPKDTRFTFDIDTMSSAVANFMAIPGNKQVTLSWTAEGEIPNLAGYNIYRSTTSGSEYKMINLKLIMNTSYTDTTVENDITYYYVMTVITTDPAESDYSEEVSATPTTPQDVTPPTTPVVIDDGEFTTNKTQLHASWTSSDPESGIVEYQYCIGTSPGAQDVVSWKSVGTTTEITHTGLNLITGPTFYFTVKAKNGVGLWSEEGYSDGIKFFPYGDVSRNGEVTAHDAALVLKYVIGLLQLDEDEKEAADVSGNESVTAYDASLILQYTVGIISRFPVESPEAPSMAGSRIYQVKVEDASGKAGENAQAKINISGGTYSGRLSLEYDEALLHAMEVSISPKGKDTLLYYKLKDGELTIGYADREVKRERDLVIKFKVSDKAMPESRTHLLIKKIEIDDTKSKIEVESGVFEIAPERTVLLQNYPNPFNPETWIPYKLSKDADVVIRIYDAKGRLVRILDLGDMRAGSYVSKGRAAYWNGRNAQGESVASGVYFYRLQAGKFTATRKTILLK